MTEEMLVTELNKHLGYDMFVSADIDIKYRYITLSDGKNTIEVDEMLEPIIINGTFECHSYEQFKKATRDVYSIHCDEITQLFKRGETQ